MKDKIHPKYFQSKIICGGCGCTFTTGATMPELRVNVCSQCHPFFTGKEKLMDAEGRVEKFKKKYAAFNKAA